MCIDLVIILVLRGDTELTKQIASEVLVFMGNPPLDLILLIIDANTGTLCGPPPGQLYGRIPLMLLGKRFDQAAQSHTNLGARHA